MRGNVFAIIALVFLVIVAGATGYLAYSNYMKVERVEGAPLGLRSELRSAQAEHKSKQEQLAKLEAELAAEKAKAQQKYEDKLKEQFNLQLLTVESDGYKRIGKGVAAWEASVKTTPNVSADLVKPVEDESAKRRTEAQDLNADQINKIIERIKALAAEAKKCRDEATAEIKRLNSEKVRLGNEISVASGDIERLISREPLANAGLPPVGRILASAADTKIAVINLGTRVGVKRGMRFEAYQVRYGNRRVHKGYLEVKSTEAEVSTCAILVKEVRLPRCPVCSYTAAQPEELYCPRCTSPGSPQAYQRLSGSPKVTTIGQSDTDPIVKGDLLYNPLFSLRPGTRYAVQGEPLIEGSKQYDRASIVKLIEFYGGAVDKELSSETDVLIALRGAKEAVNRAEEMGIPVVREFEIFRYLER